MTWPYSKKQNYMYLVFVKILLTEQGHKIVREHHGDKYAQRVYAKLSAHALKYKKALLNSYPSYSLTSHQPLPDMDTGAVLQKYSL